MDDFLACETQDGREGRASAASVGGASTGAPSGIPPLRDECLDRLCALTQEGPSACISALALSDIRQYPFNTAAVVWHRPRLLSFQRADAASTEEALYFRWNQATGLYAPPPWRGLQETPFAGARPQGFELEELYLNAQAQGRSDCAEYPFEHENRLFIRHQMAVFLTPGSLAPYREATRNFERRVARLWDELARVLPAGYRACNRNRPVPCCFMGKGSKGVWIWPHWRTEGDIRLVLSLAPREAEVAEPLIQAWLKPTAGEARLRLVLPKAIWCYNEACCINSTGLLSAATLRLASGTFIPHLVRRWGSSTSARRGPTFVRPPIQVMLGGLLLIGPAAFVFRFFLRTSIGRCCRLVISWCRQARTPTASSHFAKQMPLSIAQTLLPWRRQGQHGSLSPPRR